MAWDCVNSFLAAKFSGAERHLRRLAKVSAIGTTSMVVGRAPTVPITGEASVLATNDEAKQIGGLQ